MCMGGKGNGPAVQKMLASKGLEQQTRKGAKAVQALQEAAVNVRVLCGASAQDARAAVAAATASGAIDWDLLSGVQDGSETTAPATAPAGADAPGAAPPREHAPDTEFDTRTAIRMLQQDVRLLTTSVNADNHKMCELRKQLEQTEAKLEKQRQKRKQERERHTEALAEQLKLFEQKHVTKLEFLEGISEGRQRGLHRLQGRYISDYDMKQLEEIEGDLQDAMERVDKQKVKRKAEELVGQSMTALTCPIGHMLMRDPVQAVDGHTYERGEIEKWLCRSDKSPKTNLPLSDFTLTRNFGMKSCIDEAVQAKMKEIMAEREQAKLEQMAAPPFYVAEAEEKEQAGAGAAVGGAKRLRGR